ncbi:unnamed protein product [Ambrosiozyma monospora]|uniref:Unnamed protein product n=1 Tax=Ambrosiozyma monospora TaxID=43982 RepID=A0ACB5TC59_AMBMO|nr:unnamed protein product [Ambrosiozyma monospora]
MSEIIPTLKRSLSNEKELMGEKLIGQDAQQEQTLGVKRVKLEPTAHDEEETDTRKYYPNIFLNMPFDVIEVMLKEGGLSRRDILNLSMLSSKHRVKFYELVYQKIKLTWSNFQAFHECFKNKELVNCVRVFSDLKDKKATNYGEWNISMKDLLSDCPNLRSFVIEVMTSARSLKYQDKFDVDLSDKITEMKLITHSKEAGDDSMFELPQLQKFHNVRKLILNGFQLWKDKFFYPKYKPDFSDWKIRRNDGKLVELEDLSLINCKWNHPESLPEIFSPTYPTPSSLTSTKDSFTSPRSISLYYSEDSSSFVTTERFKSWLDNDRDEMFLFQTRFYMNLKRLNLVIVNHNYEENKFIYYYPWLNWINFKRTFPVQNTDTDEIETSLFWIWTRIEV